MSNSAKHERFRLRNLDDLRAAIERLGLNLRAVEDVSCLTRPVEVAYRVDVSGFGKYEILRQRVKPKSRNVGKLSIPNSMAVQPMEGCDGNPDGAPGELTFRRYRRFAAGGAGLLWFEACAIVPEGRANPRQLWIHKDNVDAFAQLVQDARKAASESMGKKHHPFCVLQLTHSGRYSRPENDPAPIIAYHDPLLDANRRIPADYPLVTDDYLEKLEDAYVRAARLAFQAGFDAVDIKACHRYLMNELLAAHTREGRYGGSYENRTRLLKNIIGKVQAEHGDRIVTCRLGIHDAHPYPYGWGMDKANPDQPNLDDPKRLVRELRDMGLPLINITMGNPYFNPHVNRPYDTPIEGLKVPDENPLAGVARLVGLTREIQKAVPDITVVGSGYSWLRNLWPHVASANINDGAMRIVGLGRQAFAFPGFAKEIIETGRLAIRHTCMTCSGCTQIMRDGGQAGCVPFDKEVYGPIYREGRANSFDRIRAEAERCRDCFDPLCKDGCPAGVDVPGFVRAAADGDIAKSYSILRDRNVFPELCAYVCPSDVQCEAACVENTYSRNPVNIRQIQRYVTREARRRGLTKLHLPPETGKRVAVIGAGPAGLACAARLLQFGHRVDVFDIRNDLGGGASSIPDSRLPIDDLSREIQSVFGESSGRLDFRAEALSESRNLDAFASEYDAVFLGIGLGRSTSLAETRPRGVEDAIVFLERAKTPPQPSPKGEGASFPSFRRGLGGGRIIVPERVAVLGGGNTAMDAATEAIRLGATDVYLIYRRSFNEMPAWPAERDAALEAGVHFLMLTQPVRYVVVKGVVRGVVIARTRLGAADDSGRRRPEVIAGSKSVLQVDLVLEALGQSLPAEAEQLLPGVELTNSGLIRVDADGKTSREGVYAGGDVINGGATVVQAIAEGMRAAEGIDEYLEPQMDTDKHR